VQFERRCRAQPGEATLPERQGAALGSERGALQLWRAAGTPALRLSAPGRRFPQAPGWRAEWARCERAQPPWPAPVGHRKQPAAGSSACAAARTTHGAAGAGSLCCVAGCRAAALSLPAAEALPATALSLPAAEAQRAAPGERLRPSARRQVARPPAGAGPRAAPSGVPSARTRRSEQRRSRALARSAEGACFHPAESSRAPPAPGPSLLCLPQSGEVRFGAFPRRVGRSLSRLADTPLPCSLLGGEFCAPQTRCCSPAPAATRDRTHPVRPAARPIARPAALARSAPRRVVQRAEGRRAARGAAPAARALPGALDSSHKRLRAAPRVPLPASSGRKPLFNTVPLACCRSVCIRAGRCALMPTLCLCLEGGGCCCARRGLVFTVPREQNQCLPSVCIRAGRCALMPTLCLCVEGGGCCCARRARIFTLPRKNKQCLPSAFAWRRCLARGADTRLQPSTSCPNTGHTSARPSTRPTASPAVAHSAHGRAGTGCRQVLIACRWTARQGRAARRPAPPRLRAPAARARARPPARPRGPPRTRPAPRAA